MLKNVVVFFSVVLETINFQNLKLDSIKYLDKKQVSRVAFSYFCATLSNPCLFTEWSDLVQVCTIFIAFFLPGSDCVDFSLLASEAKDGDGVLVRLV